MPHGRYAQPIIPWVASPHVVWLQCLTCPTSSPSMAIVFSSVLSLFPLASTFLLFTTSSWTHSHFQLYAKLSQDVPFSLHNLLLCSFPFFCKTLYLLCSPTDLPHVRNFGALSGTWRGDRPHFSPVTGQPLHLIDLCISVLPKHMIHKGHTTQ